jgi:hypothetical protein
MTDRKLFKSWVQQLRREFPGVQPVRVLLVPSSKLANEKGEARCGDHHFDEAKRRHTILIADRMNLTMTRDALIEEWSHYHQCHLPPATRGNDHSAVYTAIQAIILAHYRGDHAQESD